jgi:hypothetical protein
MIAAENKLVSIRVIWITALRSGCLSRTQVISFIGSRPVQYGALPPRACKAISLLFQLFSIICRCSVISVKNLENRLLKFNFKIVGSIIHYLID